MDKYQKDFVGWAKVAEEVEKRKRRSEVKVGAIYWANIGENIGSELVGKGRDFARPVLILAQFNFRMVLVIPITSRIHDQRGYHEIVVAGKLERLALEQVRPIDVLRIGDFLDEVAPGELEKIRKHWMKLMKYHFYKKSRSTGAEQDF